MEKKSKGIYILVGILTILCILLAGYIVYDKVLNNKNYTQNDKTTNIQSLFTEL